MMRIMPGRNKNFRAVLLGMVVGCVVRTAVAADLADIPSLKEIGQAPPSGAVVAGPETVRLAVPPAGRALHLVGRLGTTNAPWRLTLGRVAWLELVRRHGPPPINEYWKLGGRQAQEKSPEAFARMSTPDAFRMLTVAFPDNRWKLPYFTRPSLNFYLPPEREAVAAEYDRYPSALTSPFTLRLEHATEGISVWLDGRHLGWVPDGNFAEACSVTLAAGNELLNAWETPALRQASFLPLDLAAYARPGPARFVSEVSGLQTHALNRVDAVPFYYGTAGMNLDVGLSRWLEEAAGGGYCDNDTTRNAFIGCPESIVLQVPKENFVAAHLLCVLNPATNRIPVLTLRLTRFGRHYGDSGGRCDEAFADSTIRLPIGDASPLPRHVHRVGTLRMQDAAAEGGTRLLPVYRVVVPLKVGVVADLLSDDAPAFGRGTQHWEIELTKAIRLKGTRRKPIGPPSAVHVLAMTLERAPVDVAIESPVPGNVFYREENPRFEVRLNTPGEQAADVTLQWERVDYKGHKTEGAQRVTVPSRDDGAGMAHAVIPLSTSRMGYHDIVVKVVENPSGREIWRQQTSYVLLPPDTRRAGAESPFGTWWFCGIHGTSGDLAVMGPLMERLGMRHLSPSGAGRYKESDLAPYNLSFSMVPWGRVKTEQDLDEFVQRNPNIRLGMLFHENGISEREKDYPYPELLGKPKPELTPQGRKELDALLQRAFERAAWYRKKYPDIKLTVGNTHSPLIVQLLRHGFPKRFMDCIGIEGVSGWTTPEGQPEHSYTQEIWWIREIQRIYGYGDIPVSSGYEYITRGSQRGSGLTEREQADYYIRDALQCLAYGYWSINIGSTEDFADSYNATIYGGGGFLRRNPLLSPKPAYATWATMTRLLDRAEYRGWLETGSRSLYVLAFRRENRWVYPVWTIFGRRPVALTLEGNGAGAADLSLTDGMGNTVPLTPDRNGQVELVASSSPVYLETGVPVAEVEPGAPVHDDPGPNHPVTVASFDDPAQWEVEADAPRIRAGGRPSVTGRFTLAPVRDEERGGVTEVTLESQPEVPRIASHNLCLKARNPGSIDREVRRLGLWVKGNSCWGRVFFEFTDAHGEQYRSSTHYWDRDKVAHTSAIAFDGWRFISQELPGAHAEDAENWLEVTQAAPRRDWSSRGGDGDGRVQFPIKVTRVALAMREWQVYVTDMVPAQSRSIRLGPLMAGD